MTQNVFPTTFANLAGGNQPASLLDNNFNVACRGDSVTVVGNVPTWQDTAGKYPGAGLVTIPAAGTIAKIVGVDGSGKLPIADGSNLTNLPSAPWVGVRQTVAAGPTTSAGLPNFLPASAGSLSLSTQNISGTSPFVASSANNWSNTTGVATDSVGLSTTSLTWTVLGSGAAVTNYLYVTISGGLLTAASTSIAPIYQWGGTPSNTNGQFTFNIGAMQGFLGSGAAAPQTYAVFVGEAVASGGAVSSTVQYAYNGIFESAFTATLPSAGTTTTASHNIGVTPRVAEFIIQNTTTEFGYAVGDQVNMTFGLDAAATVPYPPFANTKTIGLTTVTGGQAFQLVNRSSFARSNLTLANWEYKFYASRGW